MDKDKISELRDAQRALDRALQRRARAKKVLDQAEDDVRTRRGVADSIMREVQLSLDQVTKQAGFDLDPLKTGVAPEPQED
jgi:hypothetical protein